MTDGIQGRMTHGCAWLLVVAFHLAFYGLLTFSSVPAPAVGREEHRTRLVLAIAPRIARPPPSPAPYAARPPSKAKRTSPAAREQPVAAAPALAAPAAFAAPAHAPSPSSDPPSWGSRWNPRQISAPDFAADPLRNRRARLPGGDRGDRFKMAPSISPAKKVVAAIGQLLGGAGYPSDPCARIQENIAGLLPDTSQSGREQLQEELRRDRRHCQP